MFKPINIFILSLISIFFLSVDCFGETWCYYNELCCFYSNNQKECIFDSSGTKLSEINKNLGKELASCEDVNNFINNHDFCEAIAPSNTTVLKTEGGYVETIRCDNAKDDLKQKCFCQCKCTVLDESTINQCSGYSYCANSLCYGTENSSDYSCSYECDLYCRYGGDTGLPTLGSRQYSYGYCVDLETTTTTTVKPGGCTVTFLFKKEPEKVHIFSSFRENILNHTKLGRKYIYLYNISFDELTGILIFNPDLRFDTIKILNKIIPIVQASLEGSPVTINKETKDEINMLCDDISKVAGYKLKKTIIEIKKDLARDDFIENILQD
jgi:hypothetical protein